MLTKQYSSLQCVTRHVKLITLFLNVSICPTTVSTNDCPLCTVGNQALASLTPTVTLQYSFPPTTYVMHRHNNVTMVPLVLLVPLNVT